MSEKPDLSVIHFGTVVVDLARLTHPVGSLLVFTTADRPAALGERSSA